MRLYETIKQITRYIFNFAVSALTDFSLYSLGIFLLKPIWGVKVAIVLSVAVARILSSLINFSLNKKLFCGKSSTENKKFFIRYYTLWFGLLVLSASITLVLNNVFMINEFWSKILADCSLGIFSFVTQRLWVFNTKTTTNKKGWFFHIVRFIGRIFVKQNMDIDQNIFKEKCVFIGHHQNFYAPIAALFYMPDTVQVWVIDHLFNFKDCFNKYYHYTFIKTMGLPKIISGFLAFFCAWIIPAFIKSANCIPVYRGSRDITKTFKLSLEALDKGNQILIFPDVAYNNTDSKLQEMHTGFLSLEKQYYRKNKEHLRFIPLIFNKTQKQISSKNGVVFLGDISFAQEKPRVEAEIITAINFS